MEQHLLDRITIHPDICFGKPCIRGMRWPVEIILDMINSGMTAQQIISDHTELETDDIHAALEYAKLLASGKALRKSA